MSAAKERPTGVANRYRMAASPHMVQRAAYTVEVLVAYV